ncbi:hypothetical protein EVAR_75859_1 [Eumeta japonica]|uniref:Uncharacterized protein n=1 Tax=Eumeta variegata TaxID=151549 RepID=A0A4C1TD75_EUMVA|nr:hypothetical protein EVAR_75859_1 [Eumeta japonica]
MTVVFFAASGRHSGAGSESFIIDSRLPTLLGRVSLKYRRAQLNRSARDIGVTSCCQWREKLPRPPGPAPPAARQRFSLDVDSAFILLGDLL